MRHVRSLLALSVIALLAVACSSPAASQPTDSNGGGGGEATATPDNGGGGGGGEATATPDNGGGGGGSGPNGSITYQITGDYEASGELPFLAAGISMWIESEGGWVANFANTSGEGAVILLNTQTAGQIFSFGDGTVLVAATSDGGFDCTFTQEQNDSSGLKGSLQCNDAVIASNNDTGALLTVSVHAEWDAHP